MMSISLVLGAAGRLWPRSAADGRGQDLIDDGYDLGVDPEAFLDDVDLGELLIDPTEEAFWGCSVDGRSGPCHDCLIEDEFPADEPAPLPPNCVAAADMFPQYARSK